MALFKRKKKESILPEVDKYYEAERRDRTGLAWLLALVSIVLVALFIIIVFLAGRWAYRAIFEDDKDVAVTSDISQQDNPSFDGGSNDNENNDQSDANKEGSSTDQPQNSDTSEPEGSVDAPATTDTPSTPTNNETSVPRTGDDPLPSTGPESLTAVFVGTSALAGGSHYVISRRRQKR